MDKLPYKHTLTIDLNRFKDREQELMDLLEKNRFNWSSEVIENQYPTKAEILGWFGICRICTPMAIILTFGLPIWIIPAIVFEVLTIPQAIFLLIIYYAIYLMLHLVITPFGWSRRFESD
jgi:hypothetical protein